MKEILFVSNSFGGGGAARAISVLTENFADKGFTVTILSFPYEKASLYQHAAQVNFVVLRPAHESGIRRKIDRIRLLRKEIKQHKGAILVSFEYFMNMQTIVAAAGYGNRIIISERNDPAHEGGKFPMRIFRNLLYRFCDILVCQTPDAREYFPESIRKKTVVIPNPLKDNLPEPWTGERKKEIVNFCRLEAQKNLKMLIDAFEIFYKGHDDYRLTIYGDGKEREEIERYVNQKESKGMILLHKSVPDIYERVLKSAIFVSSSDYEGLSNSMLEAMAIGLPTICTDCPCGGARMVIEDGVNGLLVPVGDARALAEAMSRVAENKNFAEQLSQNGQKIREKLNVEKIANEWKKAIIGR